MNRYDCCPEAAGVPGRFSGEEGGSPPGRELSAGGLKVVQFCSVIVGFVRAGIYQV